MYPDWILNMYYLDFTNGSYLSVIKSYHVFNNPVQITFTYKLLELRIPISKKAIATIKEEPSNESKETKESIFNARQVRNKLWMCVVILSNAENKKANLKNERKNVRAEFAKTSKANLNP
jgi:hypothetical protein